MTAHKQHPYTSCSFHLLCDLSIELATGGGDCSGTWLPTMAVNSQSSYKGAHRRGFNNLCHFAAVFVFNEIQLPYAFIVLSVEMFALKNDN